MKKRLVSLFLCLCVLITTFPAASAYAVQGDSLNTTVQTTYEKTDNPYTDVKKTDWFYSAVQYARDKGFFSGTSTTTFEPNVTMTRGMFVSVLGRMAGVDTANYKGKSAFSDVAADAYYAPFVAWAAKHGITSGVGDGKFAPNKLINRQQMAVFFVRYFETFGVDYETGAKITTTPEDMDNVAEYAKDAVLKLWKTGLLAGDGVNFNPLGEASRAQAAMLCMRTDETVETWYKEPGIPKEERPVVIPPSGESSSGGSPSGGSPSGGSSTVYYGVTLKAGEESTSKLYPVGTLLNTMPVPVQEGGTVFLGWYYDSALSNMVASTDTLSRNLTLYAKFTEAVSLSENGELNFVTKQDAAANFTVTINSGSMPAYGKDFKFRNITDPSVTDGTDGVEQETVSVTGSAGSFTVASDIGGFTPGHTYQIELLNDAITFAGESKEIRYYNFIIQKDEVLNLELSDGIKYIAASALTESDRNNVLEYAGLYQTVTDAQGVTTYTANSGIGSFTYSGGGIMVGDTIAVYTGKKPDKRSVEDSGAVAYLEITRIDGTTCYYQSAKSEDVLFTPDLLPIDLDAGDGVTAGNTVATNGTGSITISTSKLDFSADTHADMGLGAETVVEPGDFLSFFNNGDLGDTNASKQGYGEIISITTNGSSTIITYSVVSEEFVLSTMELYSESELTDAQIEAAYDEQLIRESVESQIMSSSFIQDAGEYLAGLAIQTDEVKEIFGSQDNLTLTDYIITYSNGTPVSEDDLALMGNIVNKEGGIKTSVSVSPRLSHFEGRKGIRAEVAVTYNFDIKKSGSNKKVEVELTAFFEQEVLFGFSVSGGAVWKKKWIFPYIADYRMTGNIDLGTYTGVGVTATAKLAEDKEPWGMPWPKSAKEAQANKKIFSLSESIKKKMEDVKTVFPEAEASSSGGLAEKYAAFMEDANDAWVDLFVVKLIDLRGGVDPLHILAYGIQVDFVVSANLNVAIGMTFQYENSKRHSFALSLKSKKADSETIDLSTNGYQFDFYVMGTLGIRAGIRAKALVGLFSTKLDGIGLQIEAGAYARLWGYFYYSLTNYKTGGVWEKTSSSSGAMLVEIGAYLDVKFVAEVLNGKYSYAPTIYAKEWPLWSAGQRENIYDFAYVKAPTYAIQNVTTYTLPTTVFEMKWMDLKTGDLGEDDKPKTKNFDENTVHNTKDEKYFAVELSNPAFTYNPVNNQITVSRASGDSELNCEMKLTWKGAPLAFSTETVSRIITLKWSDLLNGKAMVFESNGGSTVNMICKLAGANISALRPANPTKAGYTFAGWYNNRECTGAEYTFPNTMPNENVTLYAKWTPNVVSYTVEHYQKGLDGMYVLAESQTMSGISNQATVAQAKSYTGFTPKTIQQETILADGNTVVQVYYERNSFNVTFKYGAEAGNRSVEIKYPMGAKIEWINPAAPGYTFLRWDNTVPKVMPANDLTFTAVWGAWANTKYTVEHYQENIDDNGYTLAEREVHEGQTGTGVTPDVKTYEGFTAPAAQSVTVKGDGSAALKYYYTRNNYTFTYVLGNGEDDAVLPIKYGDWVLQRYDPTREGYTFGGWIENGEAASIPTTMPARDVTLSAKWNVNEYTITFDSNGGSSVLPITKEYGTAITEPTAPTRAGYNFAGWKLNGDDYTFSTMPGKNITLTADWTADSNIAYTVEHYKSELDGSYPSTPTETENMKGGTGATVTATAKSYTGFTYAPNVSGTVSSGTVKADGSLVLKAYYTRNSYTVTWNGNGGTVDTSGATTGSVKYGATIIKPANNPTKAGYTFNLWSGYTANMTMPAEDTTFTADWTVNQYTITFDSDGGSAVTAITQDYGTTVAAPTVPTKENYSFVGWQLNGKNYAFTTMPAENITLVAVWSDTPTYTVSFDANGGTVGTASKSVLAGSTYGDLPAPAYDGHYFLGWFTSTSGGMKVTSATNVELSADQTLYARWATTGYTGNVQLVLYVAGIKVATENMNDIHGDGSASVQFDPSTGTLYLNNATIAGTYSSSYVNAAIYSEGNLTIENTGTSTVTNTYNEPAGTVASVCGIYTHSGLVIQGTGTLTTTSGTGGTSYNYGIRAGLAGNYFTINGPTVKAFAGIAGSGGKSYGVSIGPINLTYTVKLRKGTLETHGYDSAAYCGPLDSTVKYFVENGSYQKIDTITVSESYDGTSATSVIQDETYRNYKYITVTNP
ncbi:InlB B-repeat-containing protein [Ruminiclostridium cellulolyticum]|uniref:Cell wall/surface repeat protein n=1 Tax=Ruminiclostridium cellulolyticum (strain ATCC 35319 / DSM 5812 / JCM 6584 / H10) TaxID=394503 RepID=B8I6X6_RUMCH|nr:InlB B-repeat-containing protein [Ruminiclostridium cellulolyticum]ACL76968.1 cell wall/surface repeat protein [Ruminiclostridium cellulolyticum H10]